MDYQERRRFLMSVFEDTMAQIRRNEELREAVSRSIASQRFVAEGERTDLPAPPFTEPAQVTVTKNRSFEAAARYARTQKTAVLNFASASNPGGGVTSGALAQEESLCRVSTLYPCLTDGKMRRLFYTPHRQEHNPLHNDDIIYTKDVVVIKDDDYHNLDDPFAVDVITCAAPNLRSDPSNAYNPFDGWRGEFVSYEQLLAIHKQRGRKILSVAAANGVEALILGAFGCGAFRNDPAAVAAAYTNILPDFLHYFRTIEFAVWCRPQDDGNYRAFANLL